MTTKLREWLTRTNDNEINSIAKTYFGYNSFPKWIHCKIDMNGSPQIPMRATEGGIWHKLIPPPLGARRAAWNKNPI